MDIKNHSQKAFVFIINLLIVVLVVLGIKEANKDKVAVENQTTETTIPVGLDVAQSQSQISTDRENKLRDLNSAPKTVEQTDQATTTVVSQPQPAKATAATPTKAPAKKTKTS